MQKFAPSPHGPDPIVLAREPDLQLGPATVRPSAREVVCGATVVSLEPRVMQVLVALARSPGAVLSRDDLIDSCWDGRIVGDDAITRCVSALRKVGRDCGGAFEIETLAKVGYRLKLAAGAPAPAVASAAIVAPFAVKAPRVLVGLAAAAMVGLAALVWALQPRPWRVTAVRSFAASALVERHATFSPDGRLVAFSRGHNLHDRNIFVQGVEGGEAVQFTQSSPAPDEHIDKSSPAWSPDGTRIAFTIRQDGVPCRLAVKPYPAGAEQIVGGCVVDQFTHAVWTGDGKGLIYAEHPSPDAPSRLMRLDLATGKVATLTSVTNGDGDSDQFLSPDGNSLLFVRRQGYGPAQLCLLNLRTGAVRVIYRGLRLTTGAWSPDEKEVFFSELKEDGVARLKSVSLTDGAVRDLYASPDPIGQIATSRSGWIAMSIIRAHYTLAYSPKEERETPQPVSAEFIHSFLPSYSSQGDLAFGADSGVYGALILLERGKPVREAARWPGGMRATGWSPDGERLAFALSVEGRAQVRIVGKSRPFDRTVLLEGRDVGAFGWLSDQRLLVPVLNKAWRLFEVDVESGGVSPAKFSNSDWDAVQVLDGQVFASRSNIPGLWRLDGVERKVSDSPPVMPTRRWRVVGNDLIYPKFGVQSVLIAEPLSGGPKRAIQAPGMTDAVMFDVDPKTGQVVYQGGSSDTDIALLRIARD